MTALKQGHFFSPINHTLDVARAITACALNLVVFLVKVFVVFFFFVVFFHPLPALLRRLNFNLLLFSRYSP